MVKLPDRCCGKCKYGQFLLTPTGRFVKNETGRCTYPEQTVRDNLPPIPPTCEIRIWMRPGVDPEDFPDCPVFEAK